MMPVKLYFLKLKLIMQCEDQEIHQDAFKSLIREQGCFLKQFDWVINLVTNDCLIDQKQSQCLLQRIEALNLEKVKNSAISLSLKGKLDEKSQSISNPEAISRKGISQKKSYQLFVFSSKIHQSFPKDLNIMIDVGCGQGYLCETLEKLTYASKPKIIGIDCNNDLIQTAKKQKPQESKVQYISQSFDSKFHLTSQQGGCSYGLISLHGCGLLFQSIVDHFLLNGDCKYFTSVSCCYNLIPCQKFRLRSEGGQLSFPNSIVIRSFLMIACQCVDTWQANQEKTQNSFRNTIFRAVLQRLLCDYGLPIPERLGKINTKNIYNFADYLKQVVKSGAIALQADKVDIAHYEQLCKANSPLIRKIWTLKGWIGLVAESFIATDRILHLRQQQGIKSQIISLFDRNISARNICIIGQKLDKKQAEKKEYLKTAPIFQQID